MNSVEKSQWAWAEAQKAVEGLKEPGLVHLAKSVQFLAEAFEQSRKEDATNFRVVVDKINRISNS